MDSRTGELRNKTYVYLWTNRQFQQEQVEWDDVNKLLQHHGFKPVFFADPVENKNLSDLVLLDKKSAGEIRTTLKTMLTDSDRRQALIQELIKTNNQLKEEAHEHMSRAAQHSQRVTELEGLLDVVKTRVQDLEDRYLGKAVQQHSHTQQLQQEKQEAQKVCQVLEQKLSKQREEAAQLQRKLYFTIKEEERRLARQSQTFQHVCSKVSQQDSPTQQQLLDVIDFYETKMTQLLDQLRSVKGEPKGSQMNHQTRIKKTSSNVTPSFKTILRAYQDQQKESKHQIEELKGEVEQLKQELETRPTLKEVKFYKHKLRRLEALNKHNNTRLPKEDITTEISENIPDHAREATLCAHYHNLLNEVSAVVSNPKAPFRLHRQKSSSVGLSEFQTLLPTLEVWAQQFHLLKDLQKGLNKLTARLMPWQPSDGVHNAAEAVKVEDMMLLVDTLLENTSTDNEKALRSPTRYTLGSMVSHFQTLFDVTSLAGVYPRMNEVYTRLGEMTNTMRNLREVLDLDRRVPPAEVVNQVAKLVSSSEHNAGFHNLLGDADIDSIIIKVKQHDEFFPAFHALITDILQTLGVSHLNDILPALESLKRAAQ
ncbi:centrosomal protein of 70 kDa isoform X1 [Larimichthys crocea]|uniref:centrosomal protein of 70 kDa isoform X1 n=1 Tax=Larimichthys crocea TaxID=215358 RepID=UPI0009015F5C|nr:centrosomal protein of 70 kDa isoform X1 [Larimichthys crocea]XP_027136788.1 centrosomal protein of 70 kDa isoform X1 [Larimichthys crocea]XP_027136789.1 centrosomal protein of 70 kDa isoform X1 [Larimichthys crocea]